MYSTIDGKSVSVVPVYGAGLWDLSGATSLWTRIFRQSWALTSITTARLLVSAPRSRTIRLSAAEFIGKKVNVASDPVFSVVKVGTSADENSSADAITGATMTSKGLGEAIAFWLKAYAPFLSSAAPAKECCGGNGGECDGSKPCCSESLPRLDAALTSVSC